MDLRKPSWFAGWLVVVALVMSPLPASAEPKPTRKQLTAQEKQLVDQLEVMTEQHNGLQVRLEQAKRAAKVARDGIARENSRFEEARQQVVKLAIESYKNGSADQATLWFTAENPQASLDQSAAINYLASQGDSRLSRLLQVMQSFSRAQRVAQDRADKVKTLSQESEKKRLRILSTLKQVRGKLDKPATSPQDPPPVIKTGSASTKALGAVKAALSQLGVPYSWGGGGTDGPTYGTDQGANIKGFDCSGLTLYAYAQMGINLPHYTGDQWNSGTRLTKDQLKPGDLVFFHSDLHHMGMYLGDGKMVHAPQTGDVVKISSIEGRPFAGGVRVA